MTMPPLAYVRRAFRLLFRKSRVEAELDEEVRACLEITVERLVRSGLPPGKARRMALVEFEGVEQVKERVREVRMGALVEQLFQDARHAVRVLARERSFTAIAVLTLALGIAVNTAVFSVLEAVLLQPLPYDHAERLTLIWSTFEKTGASRAPGAGPEFKELQRQTRAYQDIAGIWVGNGTLRGDPEPEQIKLGQVTWNFFTALGVHPALGRSFLPQEEGPGPPKAAVISDPLWHSRFGGDPHIIGQPLRLGNNTLTIAGVLAPGFRLYFPPDSNVPADIPVYVPFGGGLENRPRDLYFIRFLGRLKPQVTVPQAQADLDAVAQKLRDSYIEYATENVKLTATPLQRDTVKQVRPALLALMIGAGFVLLIGCVNVANLLLARGAARRKEIAVRASIGASRGRVVRQLFAENLVLSAVGGIAGMALGQAGVRILVSMRPESLSRLDALGVNPAVAAFVVAISIGSSIVFGLVPALEATKLNLVDALRESGRGARTAIKGPLRAALIVAEIALGFVLLTGAGLMIVTFWNLQKANPGFDARRVLTFEIQPRGATVEQIANFVNECERRVSGVPGVETVGAISHLPLDDYPNWYSPYVPDGVAPERSKGLLADYRAVTPGYFAALGARLVAGRQFDQRDQPATAPVVVVDDLLAKATWPNQSAVGKTMSVEHFTENGFVMGPAEVVGVIAHIQHHSLTNPVRGQIYIPYTQSPREHLSFVVKTRNDPDVIADPVRRELRQLNKDMAIAKVRPMTFYVARAVAPVSFTAVVGATFGGLGLLLAAIGVYSVISYSISLRTRELGVRMAVGARPAEIVGLVLREGLALVTGGLALGGICAFFVSRYLQSLLFGVAAFDPVTYGVAGWVLAVASLLACWRPAFRASRNSVMNALRLE